jgi:hypothetical protein
MDGITFITIVVTTVAITTVRHYWAIGRTKAGRECRLLKQATRAAKSSEKASKASVRLSNASTELSNAALKYAEAVEQAQQSEKVFQAICLNLYRKWLLLYSRWLIGRAMQLRDKADIKLQRCHTILDSLGIKRDA